MNLNLLIPYIDGISALILSGVLTIIIQRTEDKYPSIIFLLSLASYFALFIALSNVLEWGGFSATYDRLEDAANIIMAIVLVMAAHKISER